jgi:hypothetical protein
MKVPISLLMLLKVTHLLTPLIHLYFFYNPCSIFMLCNALGEGLCENMGPFLDLTLRHGSLISQNPCSWNFTLHKRLAQTSIVLMSRSKVPPCYTPPHSRFTTSLDFELHKAAIESLGLEFGENLP